MVVVASPLGSVVVGTGEVVVVVDSPLSSPALGLGAWVVVPTAVVELLSDSLGSISIGEAEEDSKERTRFEGAITIRSEESFE